VGGRSLATFKDGSVLLISGALFLLAASSLVGRGPGYVAPFAALLAVLAAWRPSVVQWRGAILGLLLIILFIPIRRYSLKINLPFEFEPYRIYVFLLAGLWLTFLLLDPRRMRVRATGLEAPLALLGIAVAGSIFTNFASITREDLTIEIVKKLTFWVGFMIVLYLIASVSTVQDVEFFLKTLVVGGAILGAFGIVEWKTGHNAFGSLNREIPILRPVVNPDIDTFRGGLTRAYASAQHPIAFGAALALVLPIALVLAFRRQKPLWYACAALIVMGSLAAVSRTSMVMLVVAGTILAVLKPNAARMAVPFLLPMLVAIQIALPGTFSTIRASFFPSGGLVEQQADQQVGSGRVASFGPAIDELSGHPFFGRGFGTRIVEGSDPKHNSFILDDEWLSTTLEIGLVGLVAWLWIIIRFCARAFQGSKTDDDRGWLLAALAASVGGFGVSMLFYDAFSFIQATLLFIILLAIGSVLMRPADAENVVSA
jgi:O-antigen ligase/polysaccharide polymerase Wzy-like membrane protein